MERTEPTPDRPIPAEERRAIARQLVSEGLSNRAIARRLGIHHNTVARLLRAAAEPDAPQPAPQPEPDDAPPTPTSGARPAPRLIHDLPAWLIQDLNILTDPFTGRLPEPVARAIHAAAQQRRDQWRASIARRTSHDPAPAR